VAQRLMLTAGRQARFVLAYLACPDATKAAIEAGYSPRTAKEIGYSLVHKNSLVQAEIARRSRVAMEAREITLERTLSENAAIAFADPRRPFNADGTMVPVCDWPPEVAAAVASVETEERYETGDDGAQPVRVAIRKVRFWDKGAALEKLFRYQRLYAEPPQATNIFETNIGTLDAEQRDQLRRLLTAVLP
jgi:phage terminase small subunit